MDIIASIALGAGAAWASGINVYAVILALGVLGGTGHLALPPDLKILTNPLIIAAAGFMYCVEFFADKTPGVDSVWDALHTFIRIPAGAMLAAGTFGHLDPVERRKILDWLLGQQYREVHPYTLAAPGAWAWTDLPGGVPDAEQPRRC